MSVLLKAISITDAAAFVTIAGKLRLLRPPYTLATSPQVGGDDLDDALKRSSYQLVERSFATIGDAIAFVRNEHRQWAERMGLPTEGLVSADELLSDAGPALALQIIERIEQEILPSGKFEIAEMLLAGIIKRFKGDTALELRSARLLVETRQLAQRRKEAVTVRDRRFHTLQDAGQRKKVSDISDTIRERGCVLEVR